ncbi:hypothetical protein LOK49_LG02G03955 [Camellia lanceoleosa]|uniref:Uncharacterized protein n=1 Tax=Camellia lanceoleosa TaxID=1840588 RepID=A0ACC0IPR0_9ERIC|nr:hypothetical protein LOK49_LG02G03955 [Camellia lanceoleosa]
MVRASSLTSASSSSYSLDCALCSGFLLARGSLFSLFNHSWFGVNIRIRCKSVLMAGCAGLVNPKLPFQIQKYNRSTPRDYNVIQLVSKRQKTASLTLLLVALLIVALASVDSSLCYQLACVRPHNKQ